MKYRKKAIDVEAMQFTEVRDGSVICSWCGGTNEKSPHEIQINTLSGVMTANLGDWIVKNDKGMLYACKPSVFEELYEAVE